MDANTLKGMATVSADPALLPVSTKIPVLVASS